MDYKLFFKKNKTIVIAIIYVIFPFDFFPELFLGPVGYIDDVILLSMLLGQRFLVDYIKAKYGRYVDKGKIDLKKKRVT